MFLIDFLNSIKEINRLISKGMSSIYLKVTIEKKRYSQKFGFLSLKHFSLDQYLEGCNSHRYWILKLHVAT